MIKSKRITNPDSNKCRIANPPQRSTALNFRSSHHGRGALQLADEDLPPGGRRTLRRHRAQRQTALRRLQETE